MKLTKVERAYAQMLINIEVKGMEYPTAHERVCEEFNLSDSQVAALTRKYDTEPSGRAADA